MKQDEIEVGLVRVGGDKVTPLTIDNNAESYYAIIACDTFQAVPIGSLKVAPGTRVTTHGLTLWCDEEGKLNGSERNGLATYIWAATFGEIDPIMGNALFTGGVDEVGNTLSIDPEDLHWLNEIAASYALIESGELFSFEAE